MEGQTFFQKYSETFHMQILVMGIKEINENAFFQVKICVIS